MNKAENLKFLNIDTSLYKTRISKKFENRKAYKPADPKIIMSFIPGTVIDILVKEGEHVEKGDELLILDAMKMQNRLKSPVAGIIKKISVTKGDKVSKGAVLLELK
jgi:biotin carboxyl carrier protein